MSAVLSSSACSSSINELHKIHLSGVVLTHLLKIFNCSVYEGKRNITEHNHFIHAIPSSSCAGASFSALTKAAHANSSSNDKVRSFIFLNMRSIIVVD